MVGLMTRQKGNIALDELRPAHWQRLMLRPLRNDELAEKDARRHGTSDFGRG